MAKSKTKRVRRVYKGTDAQALTTCLVQVNNLILVQPVLADRRSRYTPKLFVDLRQEVADALENDLGIDPRTAVQLLTGQLQTAQTSALGLLKSFYLDLRDAFVDSSDKTRLAELTALLGFRDHYRLAQSGNQQALSELLTTFNVATNDAALRTELEQDHDIAPQIITDIKAKSKFYQLDAAQEQGKSNVPAITDATITRFNSIYRRVQAAARLARDIFQLQPTEADKYSFSLIRRRMTGGTPTEEEKEDTPTS